MPLKVVSPCVGAQLAAAVLAGVVDVVELDLLLSLTTYQAPKPTTTIMMAMIRYSIAPNSY